MNKNNLTDAQKQNLPKIIKIADDVAKTKNKVRDALNSLKRELAEEKLIFEYGKVEYELLSESIKNKLIEDAIKDIEL